jgi:hypothetical protein
MRALILTTLLCLSTPVMATPPLSAPGDALQARYAFTLVGVQVGHTEASLRVQNGEYSVLLASGTDGVARALFNARASVDVTGVLEKDGPRTARYRTNSRFNGKDYRRHVAYDAAGRTTLIENVVPEGGWGRERRPVPEAEQQGVDPVSAAFAMFLDLPGADGRGGRSFDGRQVVATQWRCADAAETLPKTRRSVYSGPARRCTVSGEVVHGRALPRDAEERDDQAQPNPPLTVWMVPVTNPGLDRSLWLPVRFEITGRRGALRGYLARLGPPPPARTVAKVGG